MTDRQFGAALDAHFNRRFSRTYDVADAPEDLDRWLVLEGLGDGYDVHAPSRGNSPLIYGPFDKSDAESLACRLNEDYPNHRKGDPDPDISRYLEEDF